jgi:Transposase DDE domain group 1
VATRTSRSPAHCTTACSSGLIAWLVATMITVDLLAFAQTLLLHDTGLVRAEPKTLRYRLLHVAARLTRGQRRLWLRLDRHWPWAVDLAAAFTRLGALLTPTG